MTRLWALAIKELHQLRRDRLTMAMMVALPVMQLLLFGYAIDTDVRHVPTAVLDHDRSAASRDFVRRLEVTGFCDLVGQVHDYDEIARALRSNRASVAVVIPAHFEADQHSGRQTSVQLVVDGTDPMTVSSVTNTASGLVAALNGELLARAGARRGAAVTLEPTIWYNPELRTAVFIVPGLVGVILTMTMVMLTAMAVARERERERGTLEQLVVSPLRPLEMVAGKIAPYVVIGYLQMTMILFVGGIVFDVPVQGSLGLLYAVAAVFISANLALGLFFSTIAKTQQQAMQMSFFFLLPNILLSGFMFPFAAMPAPTQWLGEALPLTHFLRVVRGIALEGARLPDVLGEMLALAGILALLVAVTAVRFRKKVI